MVEVFLDKTKLLNHDFLSLAFKIGGNEYTKYIIEGDELDIKKTLEKSKDRIMNKTKRFNNLMLELEIEYFIFNGNDQHEMNLKANTALFENECISTAIKKV